MRKKRDARDFKNPDAPAEGAEAAPTVEKGAGSPDEGAKDAFSSSDSYGDVPPIGFDGGTADLSGLDVATNGAVEQFLSEDGEYGKLPHPDVFNAYPPEVQRKIMEWTDRDVKARRDDESRRRDEVMRAEVDRDRRRQMFPTIITVLALACAAVTGVVTQNPLFPLVFLLVPLAVIAARVAGDGDSGSRNHRNKPPRM